MKQKSQPSSFLKYVDRFNELKTVFDSLPDGIIAILDAHMNIATANKATAELLQMPLEKVIGKQAPTVFKKHFSGLIEVLQETMKTRKGIRNYTIEMVNPSGGASAYLVSTAIIKEIKSPDTGVVLILHDVSETTRLRKIALQMDRYGEIIGKSLKMQDIYALIETIRHYDSSVLIVGETGTGKELVARTIHNMSERKNKPFIPVNCSALPNNLIESELFGHVKGAFTGATSNQPGRFIVADGGSLFLDEIGSLNLETQQKLLRVLQDKQVEPLGSSRQTSIDIRIISATNRDLAELVAKNQFRDDLFYRLKVIQITLPPLREKPEDILLLTDYFISRLNRYYKKNVVGISPSAKNLLENYFWPGNIRELEHAIEHAFILTDGALLEAVHLPPELRHANHNGTPPAPSGSNLTVEEENIKRALLATKGNKSKAAEILNMHRTSLWRKMREFKIEKGFGKSKNK